MDIEEIINKIAYDKNEIGGIKSIVWIAAGGSHGGNYPAQYFMDRESKTIRSQSFTSNEFVYAPPKFVNENTIAVITSMRGTPETCEAANIAKQLGAATIGQYVDESRLTDICQYNVRYGSIWEDDKDQGKTNAGNGLRLAVNLVKVVEGFEHYQDAVHAFSIVQKTYEAAKVYCEPIAAKWAQQNKHEDLITVIGSGPAYASAYIFAICNIMEMLQIQAPTINSCEYFHGPFEVLEKKDSVFVLAADGRTRLADERAIRFLKQYGGEKVFILDARELGLGNFKASVREYFNHILFTPILNNVFMKALSASTGIDYKTRRYMWKVDY